MRILTRVWCLLAILFLLGACAQKIPNNFEERAARARQLKNLVLLPPDVDICLLTAGGIKEKRDDWCDTGRKNLEVALVEVLREKGYAVQAWKKGTKGEAEVAQIRPLYREVMGNVYNHTIFYPNGDNLNLFRDKVKNFDYSVGSIDKLLAEQKGDGLLVVYAEDEISSAGRKTLQVIRAINPFDEKGQSGMTWLEIALLDRKGDILWFSSQSHEGGFDLREPGSAMKFNRQVLADFPRAGK